MLVKMLQSHYGPEVSLNAGDVVEMTAKKAKPLIASDIAEVFRSPAVERATRRKKKTEKATK